MPIFGVFVTSLSWESFSFGYLELIESFLGPNGTLDKIDSQDTLDNSACFGANQNVSFYWQAWLQTQRIINPQNLSESLENKAESRPIDASSGSLKS